MTHAQKDEFQAILDRAILCADSFPCVGTIREAKAYIDNLPNTQPVQISVAGETIREAISQGLELGRKQLTLEAVLNAIPEGWELRRERERDY